jgi:pimeloyl-ACP methyl ester carboxylesterase
LWGTADPWEPIDLGRELANYPQVLKFIPLEGVGHCPQDEAPELVNPIIQDWIWERCNILEAEKLNTSPTN